MGLRYLGGVDNVEVVGEVCKINRMTRQKDPVHSKYADGTPVYRSQKPPRFGEPKPDLEARGPHLRLRWDTYNNRIYQAREFDGSGQPMKDIDFTSPTYPNGTPRPNHLPPPHQHRWLPNPTGGTPIRSNTPESI